MHTRSSGLLFVRIFIHACSIFKTSVTHYMARFVFLWV